MKLFTLALLAILTCGATGTDVIKGDSFGSPSAPIMMEVFSDFECPACKTFHDTEVPQLMRDYVSNGKVYLIYRYFPLPMHQHRQCLRRVGLRRGATRQVFAGL